VKGDQRSAGAANGRLPFARGGARSIALAVAAAVVLALAPAASAAFAPILAASDDARGVTVSYSQTASNDGPASIVLYMPATEVVKLPTKTGALIGAATVNATAGDLAGQFVTLDGGVVVAAATTPLAGDGASATVGEGAQACAGTAPTVALWVLSVRGFGQLLQLPIAVQRVDTGPLAGGLALFICPPPAGVPAGTAGRAPLGMKLVYLRMWLTKLPVSSAGTHVWHVKATPYTPGTALANPAAAAEAEAEYGRPAQLTLDATPAGKPKRASVSGRLTLAGAGVAGQTVRILLGKKRIGTAKTNASGAFATTVVLPRATVLLKAKVAVPARFPKTCADPAFATIPCTSSIVSGFNATSSRVRVAT
jgi:hypothetical protein